MKSIRVLLYTAAMPIRAIGVSILLAAAALGGCAATETAGPADFTIAPDRYGAAFDAARETLIDLGFEIDRVDARLGIITSKPKTTAGLASPWDRDQSTIGQEFEDLFNRHFRRAVITFHLSDEPLHLPRRPQTVPGPMPADLRVAAQPIVTRVEVVLERHRRPGWRIEPAVLRMSSRAMDPELRRTGMWPTYAVPFSYDPLLAERIAAQIRTAAEAQ